MKLYFVEVNIFINYFPFTFRCNSKNICNINKTNINNDSLDENTNDNKSEDEPEVEPVDDPIEEEKTKKVTVKKVNKKKSNNDLADV